MSRRWSIFAITSAHFFLSQFYRTSNAVIAPQLIQDLSLTTEALGLMSASFFYAFALTQIPLSLFLDKIGAHRPVVVGHLRRICLFMGTFFEPRFDRSDLAWCGNGL
jgi:fucose permease